LVVTWFRVLTGFGRPPFSAIKKTSQANISNDPFEKKGSFESHL
jgi:hypothetical protein